MKNIEKNYFTTFIYYEPYGKKFFEDLPSTKGTKVSINLAGRKIKILNEDCHDYYNIQFLDLFDFDGVPLTYNSIHAVHIDFNEI